MRTCADMPYYSGIELRIYPSNKQKHIVAVNDGCRRFVYNRLVSMNAERYVLSKTADIVPVYQDRLAYLDSILRADSKATALKNTAPFLYGGDVDSNTVLNAMKNYNAAWNHYRKVPGSSIPTFHKKGYEQSYQTNAHYPTKCEANINAGNVKFLDAHHMQLPIIGKIRIAGPMKRILSIKDRKDTRIGTVTIRRDSIGRYFVSLQLASEYPFVEELPKTRRSVGIDLNLENFLWDSDNNEVKNPKYKRSLQDKLAKKQRIMSRRAERAKKEGRSLYESMNYQESRQKVAYLHIKAAARGEDFRNVISKRYIESQDYIFAEDLQVKNLLKNHRLAYAISDVCWSDFLHKLEYKAKLYGKSFVKVPPQNTTQTCSECGYVLTGDNKLKLSDREWICPQCGAYHVRDHNAAKNILSRGQAASD